MRPRTLYKSGDYEVDLVGRKGYDRRVLIYYKGAWGGGGPAEIPDQDDEEELDDLIKHIQGKYTGDQDIIEILSEYGYNRYACD